MSNIGSRRYVRAGALVLRVALAFYVAGMPGEFSVGAAVLTDEHYTVEYKRQDSETAGRVGDFIEECWNEAAESVGADPDSPPVRVIIPGSAEQFRKFTGRPRDRWVVGLATREGSVIILKPPRLIRDPFKSLRQTVRHELTHVMLSRVTNVENMPRWLNEGMALRVSGELRRKARWTISAAKLRGALIPLDKLDQKFPETHKRAGLAYAESLDVVEYMVEEYGEEALLRLIHSLRDQDFRTALETVLGVDLATLNDRWIRSVSMSTYVVALIAGSLSFWLMTTLVILAFLRKRRLARRKRWEWEMEELMGDDV